MDSRNPLSDLSPSGKQESNAIPLYNRRTVQNPASLLTQFEFFRFRFHFGAIDPVYFPAGKSGNVIRGALGMVLRDTASPAAYARLFEPSSGLGKAPSGLGDWPRPFVLRAGGLDGRAIAIGEPFRFDVHVFDLRAGVLEYFREAFAAFGAQGIGPGHGRVSLERVEQLNPGRRGGWGGPPAADPRSRSASRPKYRARGAGACALPDPDGTEERRSVGQAPGVRRPFRPAARPHQHAARVVRGGGARSRLPGSGRARGRNQHRSEERRVRKECRSRWSPYH